MISQINIPDFIQWALNKPGYYLDKNGKLRFYHFKFAILDKGIQNRQFKLYLEKT